MKEKVIQMWHLQLNFHFQMKVLLYFKRDVISEIIIHILGRTDRRECGNSYVDRGYGFGDSLGCLK